MPEKHPFPLPLALIVAAMLLLAVAPLPYGYYTLLRIVVTGALAWGAFVAYFDSRLVLPWVLGLGALLFNPFIPVHLDKEIWMVIDPLTAVAVLITWWVLRPVKHEKEEAASHE